MFGSKRTTNASGSGRKPRRYDFELMFGWLFILAALELGFTVDTFQYLQRTNAWSSTQERQRISFLLFSSIRSVLLAAVYLGSHLANKWFHSLHHTIFLFLNTVFWIVGGVLVHQTLGYIECGGVGPVKGGLSECHELKIIEILAWIIAASSIVITVPIVMGAMKRQKEKAQRGETKPQRRGWFSRLGFKRSNRNRESTSAPIMHEHEKQQATV
ncbi:hypothetical protein M408DRAFT_333836 [Serendipita vermifera MAFF 305830]|uniref:MARVEL domain-containing protein n=1 Tax=Serendipita vermifera MAFF 305830 TaxID=933852 RepID=A0A0C3AL18_SERVB|nr:hypothetical protein M408DRAFT_333836 [Serendipita vermifera MAFF 305830]